MKLFTIILLIWSALLQSNVEGKIAITGSDIYDSLYNIITGVGQEISHIIPTTEKLFNASKQLLFGFPESAIFQTLNKICSLYLASDKIVPRITPEVDQMYLQLRTPCTNSSFPLARAEEILQSPDFDVNKKVAIFVTGWMSDIHNDYIGDMAKAYNCRGGYNFLALNTSYFMDTLYTWSAFNTEDVGRILAEGLQKLVEQVPAENIHLIGHSLGAHIVGYAGRYFTQITGLNITRITGLDPANPCFNQGESLSGLQRGDASFIDIIHTNPGVLGKANSVGDVDFYAGGLAPIKPGCILFGCSHLRAYHYYTETVYPGNETDFMGIRCSSLENIENGFCNGPQFPMGFGVPYDLKGDYFLSVNKKEPYGQNANGDGIPASSQCGRCSKE